MSIAHDVHTAPSPAHGGGPGDHHGPGPLDGKWSAPVGHPLPTSTGLDNRKLLMWLFLASDCMFFGSLIGTFMVYKGRSTVGPSPHEIFDIPYTSVSAFVLLMSSLTMVLALAAIQRNDQVRLRIWLITTALLQVGPDGAFRAEGRARFAITSAAIFLLIGLVRTPVR